MKCSKSNVDNRRQFITKAEWHWEKITLNNPIENVPLRLVSDAAMASVPIADGRLIPVLLVDTSSRPDIESLIKAHKYITPGDVESVWAKLPEKQNTVKLILSFKKPSECIAILEFDILKQGGIVDQIILSQALYFQCAREGERLLDTLDRERIVVEVPSKQFEPEWNNMLFKALEADGKKKGLSKREAKEYGSGVIKEWRKLGEMRMKGQ